VLTAHSLHYQKYKLSYAVSNEYIQLPVAAGNHLNLFLHLFPNLMIAVPTVNNIFHGSTSYYKLEFSLKSL